ncbi:MAG: hypothetical protein KJ046_14460 [Anaerolineae bacterium]|nr:hypothetical protein [Anaerolineae bacterium]RIK23861.1 MAG: hypothetical protein DCC51_02110 [Anaerolineae bacterium]
MAEEPTPTPEQEESTPQVTAGQRRWFWVRTGLIAALTFIFVVWLVYPTRGSVAILWALGFTAVVSSYFILSYFRFYR